MSCRLTVTAFTCSIRRSASKVPRCLALKRQYPGVEDAAHPAAQAGSHFAMRQVLDHLQTTRECRGQRCRR